MTQALSDLGTLGILCVGAVVVSEFGCASFLYLKIEKGTSCLPHWRLYDHPGKWGATSEFEVGLAKQTCSSEPEQTLASEETLSPQT